MLMPILIILVSSGMRLNAGSFTSDAKGTTGASFLSMGMGARALGMSGAYSAVADDTSAVSWNPAGLVRAPELSVMFMHSSHLADISVDYLSFAHANGVFAFGGSVSYLNGGDVEHTDASGRDLGSYHPKDYVGTFSYAADLAALGAGKGKYSAGISGKWISSRLIESADTFAFDVGLSVKTSVSGRVLWLALVAQNMGRGISFDKERDPLPGTFKAGGAVVLSKGWMISADVVAPRGNAPYFCAGAEYTHTKTDDLRAILRFGANTLTMSDIQGISAISGGLGLVFKDMSVDYAVAPFGGLGVAHRVSLSIKFSSERM